MAFETDIRVRTNAGMKAYFKGLAKEVSEKTELDVTFSDIVREFLQKGINNGELKQFAINRYSCETKTKEAA